MSYQGRQFLAIDPGEIHVGWAEFVETSPGKWVCISAVERAPERAAALFFTAASSGLWNWLVIEEWVLFADKARKLIGSDMPTSQFIGVLKYLARMANGARAGEVEPIEVVMQPASAKDSTPGIVRHRGIKSVAVRDGTGIHAKEAELHGWYFIIHTLKEGSI